MNGWSLICSLCQFLWHKDSSLPPIPSYQHEVTESWSWTDILTLAPSSWCEPARALPLAGALCLWWAWRLWPGTYPRDSGGGVWGYGHKEKGGRTMQNPRDVWEVKRGLLHMLRQSRAFSSTVELCYWSIYLSLEQMLLVLVHYPMTSKVQTWWGRGGKWFGSW